MQEITPSGQTDSETSSGQRVFSYDVLRVLATFAIVMIHACSLKWYDLDVTGRAWLWLTCWESAARWGVPIFVMISGALFLDPAREIKTKTLYLVQFLRRKAGFVKRRAAVVRALCVVSVLFIAVSALWITSVPDQPVFAAYDELFSGRLKSNADYWENYLNSLSAQTGMDVETPLPDDLTSHFMVYYQLLPDPTHWVNEAMARYYGLRSIRQDVHCGQVFIR